MMRSVTTAVTVGLLVAFSAPALAEDFQRSHKMTLHDWTGQLITTQIMGEASEEAGLQRRIRAGRLPCPVRRARDRRPDVAMEIWATTGKEAMDAATATGKVENLGETGMQAKEEWWFPEYMKEKCPGLPNWEALKDPKCAEAFSTPETAPKGRYLGGPVTWGGFDEERVAALGLPFEVVHAGTDAALFAELEAPISARRRSCCGSTRRTGRRPSTRASGSSSRNTSLPATTIRNGASTRRGA